MIKIKYLNKSVRFSQVSGGYGILESIDQLLSVNNDEFKESMKRFEVKLGELQRKTRELKIPIIFVFEGWHVSGWEKKSTVSYCLWTREDMIFTQ